MAANIPPRIPGYKNPYFALFEHPTRRSAARAIKDIPLGHTVFTELAVTTVLADSQRGKRCDACFKVNPKLIRCGGCKNIWYCSPPCLKRIWDAHHSRLCAHLGNLLTALKVQVQQNADAHALARKDVLLVLQLVAKLYSTPAQQDVIPPSPGDAPPSAPAPPAPAPAPAPPAPAPAPAPTDFSSPGSVFAHLLPARSPPRFPVPYPFFPFVSDPPRAGQRPRDKILQYLACRFHNNNFGCWTSDMQPLADGVFPLASRLFNHSCRPNCVVAYEITDKGLVMEIRTIRPVATDEEMTIAYVDPAIWLGARRNLLRLNYDFVCTCAKCEAEERQQLYTSSTWLAKDERVTASTDLIQLMLPFPADDALRAMGAAAPAVLPLPAARGIEDMPRNVLPMFNSTHLPEIAGRFADQSHDGPLNTAVYNGKIVLAIYLVHYTTCWPMIGLHCFELSKTMWNYYMTMPPHTSADRNRRLFETICYAEWAIQILRVSVARKGDGGSGKPPTEEVQEFRDLVLAEWSGRPA